MITDRRRSGGNGGVVLPVRAVFPRLSDLTAGLSDLMECVLHRVAGETQGYVIAVMDFADARHTLALRGEGRGGMATRTVVGWAVSRRPCCGMAAAPLFWCQVGAAAGRRQALLRPQELKLHIFFERRKGLPGVLAELAPKQVEELKAKIQMLRQAKGMDDMQQAQRVAGRLSWQSGLFP